MSHHIVLLGDSIFDNAAYTDGEPDVVAHLRARLSPPWRVTKGAVDGSVADDLSSQLDLVPADASHLLISIGGNDALMNADLLATGVSSTSEALELFAERLAPFALSYRAAIARAVGLGRDTTVCTIYEGDLSPEEGPLAQVALMMFNDVILRTAFARRLRVIDLRFVCTESADHANSIEPSGAGGSKIAAAIAAALGVEQGGDGYSPVYPGAVHR